MSFVYWTPNADGDWSNPAFWSGGSLPGSADTVTISTSTFHTITHSGGNDTIASLSVGNDLFALTGGLLDVTGAMSMADGFTQTNGSLFSGGTISITGTAQLLGGVLGGSALLEATGVVSLSSYTISGSAQLINTTTVNQTGNVNLASSNPAIINESGAVFDIAAGNVAISSSGTPVSSFTNAGMLEMTAPNNVTSLIQVDLASTGTISAAAGSNLEIDGPSNAISGTITGTGQVSFGGGTTSIASGTVISPATIGINGNGTNVTFAGAQTLSGNLSVSSASTLTLGGNTVVAGTFSDLGPADILLGNHTLTLQGAVQLENGAGNSAGIPFIGGTGRLVTSGTTTVLNNNGAALTLGGSVAWYNLGTINQSQTIQLGTASGSAASLVNQAGGVFDMVIGNIALTNGSAPVSKFSNAGTIEMTATNAVTSRIYADLASTGVIFAVAGSTLELDGPVNTISGTIAGTGEVSFGTGTTTIAKNTSIGVTTLGIYGTGTNVTFASVETLAGSVTLSGSSTLTLGGNTTIAGSFSDVGATDILLGSHTLTLQGNAIFQESSGSPLIAGTGALVTRGTTTLVNYYSPQLVLGGSVAWDNYGTVLQNQSFQIGTASGSAASMVNESKAVFDIALSGIAISNGSTPVSTFSNTGTLEMTATNGTSSVQTDLLSTGVISAVAGGNLEIDGPSNTISGKITGTGQVSFGGGTTTIAGGSTINIASLDIYNTGTNIVLGSNETVSGGFLMAYGSVLSLGGNTLTLAGAATFYDYNYTPQISGPGTLVTQGTTSLTGGGTALVLGSGVTWNNTGLVNDAQNFQIGNSTSSSATLVNAAGAVFDITAYYLTIENGSTPTSLFSNAGTLEMTNTSGRPSFVQTDLVSTGVLSAVAGGNLEIDGPVNSVSGTITGTGQVSCGGGTTTIAGGTTLNVAALDIYSTGTNVVLSGNETVSGAFLMAYGSVLALGGNTLTLAGAATFYDYNQTPLIAGPGTLVTQGTTSLTGGGTALVLGSGVTWENTGLVNDAQNFQIGNSTSSSATVVNAAGAVFDITAYYLTISNGSTPTSLFSNAGTLEMTNTSGRPSFVQTDLVSTGVLSAVAGGNLEIDGPINGVSGTITGTGQVSFGAGTTTIAGGTSISPSTLALYNAGTDMALTGNVTVSGAFNDSNATTISLAGHTLTLSAAAVFNQYYGTPLILGKGTLVTQGATSVGGGSTGLVLGGTATWNNFGMVTDSQSMQFGDSTNGAATVNNEKAGVFDIVVNGVTLSNGSTLASTFTNAGLLEMTVGGGASLAANVTNTGTVLAQSGGLALSGAVSGNGVLEVQSGGTLGFSGTVQSTETAKFLDTTGRLNITLPSASAFGAEITGFVAGDTIDLTNISNATGTFSAGMLTFADNTSHAVVATLNFANAPSFSFASDGHGGTLISATSHAARGPGPVSQTMRFIGPHANGAPAATMADHSPFGDITDDLLSIPAFNSLTTVGPADASASALHLTSRADDHGVGIHTPAGGGHNLDGPLMVTSWHFSPAHF